MANKQSTTRKTVANKTTTKRTAKSTVIRTKSTVPRAKSTIPRAKSTVTRAKSTVPRAKSTGPRAKSTVTRTKKSKISVPGKTTTKRKTAKSTVIRAKSTVTRAKSTVPRAKSTVTRTKKSKISVPGKTTKRKTAKSTVSLQPYPKHRRSKKDFKWDQLPTVPFEKICSFLWNSAGCDDLASLRQVNRRMKAGVDGFMALSSNRPRLESILFEMKSGRMYMQLNVHQTNIPFYDMTHIDKRRFKRASEERDGVKVSTLRTTVKNTKDPILDQARFLLSTTQRAVFVVGLWIGGYSIVSSLIGSARIDKLYVVGLPLLDDPIGEKILSFATQTLTSWCIVKTEKVTLTDPGAFVNGLDSQLTVGLRLRETSRTATNLFGMAADSWEKLLSEKLRVGAGRTKIWCDKIELAETPVDISGFDLNVVEWKK